jgi:hypothetical protein
MRKRKILKHSEQVTKAVLKHWSRSDSESITKELFSEGLCIIIDQVAKDTKMPFKKIAQHTQHIIDEFEAESEEFPEEMKSKGAMVSIFYMKYLQKMGKIY